MLKQATHVIVLYLLVTQLYEYMVVVGPFAYLAFTLPMNIPYFGKPYAAVVSGRFLKLQAPFKLLAWILAGNGGVFGFLLYARMFGNPTTRSVWYCLLTASIVCLMRSSHYILLFQHHDVEVNMTQGVKFMRALHLRDVDTLNLEDRKRLFRSIARSTFVDTFVTSLIQLLSSCGLAFFALSQLGLVSTLHGTSVTLWNCLVSSFSLASFGAGVDIFIGERWRVIRMAVQLLLFIWTVLYVSLASSTVNDANLGVIAETTMLHDEERDKVRTDAQDPEPVAVLPPDNATLDVSLSEPATPMSQKTNDEVNEAASK